MNEKKKVVWVFDESKIYGKSEASVKLEKLIDDLYGSFKEREEVKKRIKEMEEKLLKQN